MFLDYVLWSICQVLVVCTEGDPQATFARQSWKCSCVVRAVCPVLCLTRSDRGSLGSLLIMGLWAKTQDRRLSKSGAHYYPWREWLPLSPHKCKFPSHPQKGPIHILSPTDLRSLNERIPPDTTRIYQRQSPGNSCLAFLLALHPQVSHQPGRFFGGVVATISCFSPVH